MEHLNRINHAELENECPSNSGEDAVPKLALTKSEKELRLINRNRDALNKRDEMLAMQNVDVESSFASSHLPEDKRSIEKRIRACLLESTERVHRGPISDL